MAKLTIGVSGIKPWGIRKVNVGKTPEELTADKIRICLYFYKPKKYTLSLHCKTIFIWRDTTRIIEVH